MNLAIITSNDIYRESLKTALNQITRFKVRLECHNCSETLQQIAGRKIDVVLLTSADCGDDLGRTLKRLHQLVPGVKILMLLDHPEECWRTQAISSGADDAIPQYADKDALEEHICRLSQMREHTTKWRKILK